MTTEASAKLYLENAVVKSVKKSTYDWMVKVTVERQNREGESFTNWFTLWFKERPDIEPGWVISASGYLRVKTSMYEDKPRASVELYAPHLQSAVPGATEESDPWAGSAEGWG